MVTRTLFAIGLLLSLLFVACSDGESAPQSEDETAAQVVPEPAQTSAGDEVSETTADPEPSVPIEQGELDPDESQSEPAEAVPDEPPTETPASEEPASEQPVTEEPAVPLPDWAVDAVELTVERRLPSPDERLLALTACTQCDGGTGDVGSWVGGEDAFDDGLERTLFQYVVRGRAAVAAGGSDIALQVCNDPCGEGVPPSSYSVYVSRDGGWFWEEFVLPEGIWILEGFTTAAQVILRRVEQVGDQPWELGLAERVTLPAFEPLPPEGTPLYLNRNTTALDGDGLRWYATSSVRNRILGYSLFHGDDLVRDFEPYAVSDLALDVERDVVAAGLYCGPFTLGSSDATDCYRSFSTNVYLWTLDGESSQAFRADVAALQGTGGRSPGTPTLQGLRWDSPRTLWGQLSSSGWRRPARIDLDTGEVSVFVEEDAQRGDIVPLAYGPGQEREVPLRLVPAASCVDLRPMPRERAGEEPLACVAEGVLTGEIVVDAEDRGWYFVVADDASGWTSAGLALD